MIIFRTIAGLLGIICGYIVMAIFGWTSLFFLTRTDAKFEALQNWVEKD